MRKAARLRGYVATACALAGVGLVLAACTGGGSVPAGHGSTPRVTRGARTATTSSTHPVPASSRVPTSTAAPTSPRPIGLWHGVPLGRVRVEAGTLAAIGGRLYGTIRVGPRKQFVRLDTRTGAVVARSAPILQESYGPPVGAGGLVWFQGKGSERLLGLDPATLERRASVNVHLHPGAGAGFAASLAPAENADTLLVGGQYRVAFVDAIHARVDRYLDVDGAVTGASLSPDGSKLYVANTPRGTVLGIVRVLDPTSGAVLASIRGNPALGVQATAGGLWLTQASGMEAGITFLPSDDLTQPANLLPGTNGGGNDVLPTISGGVEWLGGYGVVGCADPATGKLRARATVRTRRRKYLWSITVSAGRVYALYGSPAGRLVTLRPPQACGVR